MIRLVKKGIHPDNILVKFSSIPPSHNYIADANLKELGNVDGIDALGGSDAFNQARVRILCMEIF